MDDTDERKSNGKGRIKEIMGIRKTKKNWGETKENRSTKKKRRTLEAKRGRKKKRRRAKVKAMGRKNT